MSELDLAITGWEKTRIARLESDEPLTVVERYLETCRRNMKEAGIWEKAYPHLVDVDSIHITGLEWAFHECLNWLYHFRRMPPT